MDQPSSPLCPRYIINDNRGNLSLPQSASSDLTSGRYDDAYETSAAARAYDDEDSVIPNSFDFPYKANLQSMPHDVLLTMLSYLTVEEVERKVMVLSWALYNLVCHYALMLWKEFCERTGKLECLKEPSIRDSILTRGGSIEKINYRSLYYRIPCIPVDANNFQQAIDLLRDRENQLKTVKKSEYKLGKVKNIQHIVSVLPGLYSEQVNVEGIKIIFKAIKSSQSAGKLSRSVIKGKLNSENEPSIQAYAQSDGAEALAHFIGFEVLHKADGTNIWEGNCAAYCEGIGATLILEKCSIHSETGRGIVATRASSVVVNAVSVEGCAATGIYIGDEGTHADIYESNIISNGFGNLELGIIPGHSGIYCEAAKACVSNCLVSGNSLTALTVVRSGEVILQLCDITQNGRTPQITVDEVNSEHSAGLLHEADLRSVTGSSIVRKFVTNNYNSLKTEDFDGLWSHSILYGGRVRNAPRVGESD